MAYLSNSRCRKSWAIRYYQYLGEKEYIAPHTAYLTSLTFVRTRVEDDDFSNFACVMLLRRKGRNHLERLLSTNDKEEMLAKIRELEVEE